MERCPHCLGEHLVKDGFVGNRQRYLCKACDYHFTVYTVSYRCGMSVETKRLALEMYNNGLSFRSMGRILDCSHVSVYKWIKKAGAPKRRRKKSFRMRSSVPNKPKLK